MAGEWRRQQYAAILASVSLQSWRSHGQQRTLPHLVSLPAF
jgi:hypothetical protein